MSEIFTLTLLIRIITSFICSIAFAVIFRVASRHLLPAGLAGVIVYFIYHVIVCIGGGVFAAAFFSTAAGAAFAEVYARVRRCPVIIVLSASIIPTVPGGDLYRTMQAILLGNADKALIHLADTMSIALGIAGGIVIIALTFRIISDRLANRRAKNGKK